LLSLGRARESLPIFQLIVDKFPHRGDAEDSLARGHHVLGDTKEAIRHYRRELTIDPSVESAKRHVEGMTRQAVN